MKLAIVTQDFPPALGGIQTYSWELAKRFAERAEACCVLAPNNRQAVAETERVDEGAARLGLRVFRCGQSTDAFPLSVAPRLASLAARGEVDVAFHSQWQTLPVAAGLRRAGRLRGLFAAVHGRELQLRPMSRLPPLQAAYDWTRTGLLRATDHLFPVSRYTGDQLERTGIARDRYTVVNNGTDPAHFHPRPSGDLRHELGLVDGGLLLLFAGRLVPNKGVDTVLRALPALLARHPALVFAVVGGGPDGERLRALAAELGVSDACRFVGRVPFDALPNYYAAADIFATLSRAEPPAVEGFGITFLEAGACGTAVIGARSGGIPDAIVDGETGLLVPPNDPAAFAATAGDLLANPARRRAFGQAGRAHVLARGTWDAASERLLAVMAQALD